MTDAIKSILAGIVATPVILILIIGIGLACGLNPHFLLVSVLITNIFGIFFNRNSVDFFNIGVGLVVLMFVYRDLGLESGYFPTFILFAVPATIFTLLSFLPVKYLLIPNRVIAILSFGIGCLIIIKQIPFALGLAAPHTFLSILKGENSFLEITNINNWIQLAIAVSIPVIALIGNRMNKGSIALVLATIISFGLGYLFAYDTSPLGSEMLYFNTPFQLNWTFSSDMIYSSLEAGITVSLVMLISFWSDFSTLNHDQDEQKQAIKKSLRTVGIGNLISGFFGVMPANISLMSSFSIRALGGKNWISKIPILLSLLIIAIIGIPNFNIPLFPISGFLMYIGMLLLLKSWQILKEAPFIDYIFTIIIGSIIFLMDFNTAFILAMLYAFIFYSITSWNQKNQERKTFN